jgi:hypothetical protein
VNYSGAFGALASGTHTYTITASDKTGHSSVLFGKFTVTNSGPVISNVVIVPAKKRMTWNAQDTDGVRASSLTVDSKAVSRVCGPYLAKSGVNFSAVLGTFTPGTHTYTITAVDKLGNRSQYKGSFRVAALMVEASVQPQTSVGLLTYEQLAPIMAEAKRRWTSTMGTQVVAMLSGVTVQIADLPTGMLGETIGGTIVIDRDATGYGWFVDPTPDDDLEFTRVASIPLVAKMQTAAGRRADLLTAVMHEMGHVLGYNHSSSLDLMCPLLPLGEKRSLDE